MFDMFISNRVRYILLLTSEEVMEPEIPKNRR